MSRIIEISKMNEVTGRSPVKIVLHEIFPDDSSYNLNGISWNETYTNDNISTCVGMPIVAQFIDDTKTICSGHGDYEVDEDGNVTFGTSSETVGSINEAYIDTVEIDGEDKRVLVGEGVLYNERYKSFVDWLKEELINTQIKTSVEIGKKSPNENIIYDGGWKAQGRIPQLYDYTGTAILSNVVKEADPSAVILELNKNNNEVKKELKTIKGNVFELNALNYYDICSIITRAFNKLMNPTCSYWCWDYNIHKFYPTESYVVMEKNEQAGAYWQVPYTITNGSITLGDVTEVEEDWKPKNNEVEVKVDLSSLKEDFNNKCENEKNIGKNHENNSNEGGNNKMDETKIQELNSKVEELATKVTELNSTIVEANKALETEKAEKATMTEELNSLKAFKEEKDLEAKKAEINLYFDKEVKLNGFTEVELNSLKADYVDKMDLVGLKTAEAGLCVLKVKELNSIKKTIETNSQDNTDLFMAIHNTEKSDEDISDLF